MVVKNDNENSQVILLLVSQVQESFGKQELLTSPYVSPGILRFCYKIT